jgi:hypothetical protein
MKSIFPLLAQEESGIKPWSGPATLTPSGAPISSVTEIPKTPAPSTEYMGEVGRPTLNQIFGMPAENPSSAGEAPAQLPVPDSAAQPAAAGPRSDGRDMLRATARALILKGSPAQKVQGLQMMFEANQPTPEEKAQTERERLVAALDEEETMKTVMKKRARMSIMLGARPDDILKMATGDDAATKRAEE